MAENNDMPPSILFGAIGTWLVYYGRQSKLELTVMMEHAHIMELNWSRAVGNGYLIIEFVHGVTHYSLTLKALEFFDKGYVNES